MTANKLNITRCSIAVCFILITCIFPTYTCKICYTLFSNTRIANASIASITASSELDNTVVRTTHKAINEQALSALLAWLPPTQHANNKYAYNNNNSSKTGLCLIFSAFGQTPVTFNVHAKRYNDLWFLTATNNDAPNGTVWYGGTLSISKERLQRKTITKVTCYLYMGNQLFTILPHRTNHLQVLLAESDRSKFAESLSPIPVEDDAVAIKMQQVVQRSKGNTQQYHHQKKQRKKHFAVTLLAVFAFPSDFCDDKDHWVKEYKNSLTYIWTNSLPSTYTVDVNVTGICYPYQPTGDLSTDLTFVSTNAYIASMRNKTKADFVTLIINADGDCGLGYRPSLPLTSSSERKAFSVVKGSCAIKNFALSHEIGHNFGMQHDRYASTSKPEKCNYGYYPNKNGKILGRTIMSYSAYCGTLGVKCAKLPFYSNTFTNDDGVINGIACDKGKGDDPLTGMTNITIFEVTTLVTLSNITGAADGSAILQAGLPVFSKWR